MPTKQQQQMQALEKQHRSAAAVEEIGQTVRALIFMAGLCFIAWCGYLAVAELSGKITDANIAMNVLGKIEVSIALAWAFGAGGIVYGMRQKSLRQRTVRRLAVRIQMLEAIIDPARTSSKLGPHGETNAGDK